MGKKLLTQKEFLAKAKKLHNQNFKYLSEYKGNSKPVLIQCNNCNSIFERIAGNILDKRKPGCFYCKYKKLAIKQTLSIQDFENECSLIHNNKYEYYQDYTKLSNKIKIYCKFHKEDFYQRARDHKHKKYGCSKCHLSKGELQIISYLNLHQINYIRQKSFDGCTDKLKLKFDFYLPDYNLCIEYDGELHFIEHKFFGGKKKLNDIKRKDLIKSNYCKNNNINLLRIKYTEINNIDLILQKVLND